MTQVGIVCIPEPIIFSDHDAAKDALFIMKINVNRMEYMIELGYFCNGYSEEEWQKFKKVEIILRNQHPSIEYHT